MSNGQPGHIGPYTLMELLATGAHAQVWSAMGPRGEVALKVARADGARTALRREAALLARTQHPHLAQLIDADPEGGWLALRRVQGVTLDQWSHEQDLPSIVEAAVQLLAALSYLHENGIVHADVKPTNVLVAPDGTTTLIDLGVATHPGEGVEGFRGTLGYAAPELLNGRPPPLRRTSTGSGRCSTPASPAAPRSWHPIRRRSPGCRS